MKTLRAQCHAWVTALSRSVGLCAVCVPTTKLLVVQDFDAYRQPVPHVYASIAANPVPVDAETLLAPACGAEPATPSAPQNALLRWSRQMNTLQQEVAKLQKQEDLELERARQDLEALRPHTALATAHNPAATVQDAQRQSLLAQLQSLQTRLAQERQATPRKCYVTAASSPTSASGAYYARLKKRIEALGNTHFPQHHGRKLYGTLAMAITLDAQGRVLQTEILASSGDRRLDLIAQAIVRAGAPYAPFTAHMRQHFDLLVIGTQFQFKPL